MNQLPPENKTIEIGSGSYIHYFTVLSSGTQSVYEIPETTALDATQICSPIFMNIPDYQVINVFEPRHEIKEEYEGWLKLAATSFNFWDNDGDSRYDNL